MKGQKTNIDGTIYEMIKPFNSTITTVFGINYQYWYVKDINGTQYLGLCKLN